MYGPSERKKIVLGFPRVANPDILGRDGGEVLAGFHHFIRQLPLLYLVLVLLATSALIPLRAISPGRTYV